MSAGQIQIEQDERRDQAIGELGGRVLGGCRLGHPEALQREVAREDRPKALVVLDEQDMQRVAPSWLRHLDPNVEVLLIGGPQGNQPDTGGLGQAPRRVQDLGPETETGDEDPRSTLRGHEEDRLVDEPQLTVELSREGTSLRDPCSCPHDRPAPKRQRRSGGVGGPEDRLKVAPSSAMR